MWVVIIEGKYSTLEVEYPCLEDAQAGTYRARNKIAFSKAEVRIVER
mgnify:CR=1 FL=1